MILNYELLDPLAEFRRATESSAGIDLRCTSTVMLNSREFKRVGLGVRVRIPPAHVGLLTLRSSWSRIIEASTTPGIIDEDYRGELMLFLRARPQSPYLLAPESRIAQLVVVPKPDLALIPDRIDPDETRRADGGFGSTG